MERDQMIGCTAQFLLSSLGARPALLILLVPLPAFGPNLHDGIQERRSEVLGAKRNALRRLVRLGRAAALTLVAAWALNGLLVFRRVNALADTTRRVIESVRSAGS